MAVLLLYYKNMFLEHGVFPSKQIAASDCYGGVAQVAAA